MRHMGLFAWLLSNTETSVSAVGMDDFYKFQTCEITNYTTRPVRVLTVQFGFAIRAVCSNINQDDFDFC